MHGNNPPASAWIRLRKRRSARVALWIIGISTFVAIFAYPLAPDNSPDANRMIIGLGARPPGFTKLFIEVPRTGPAERKPFLARLFTGTPPARNLVPINRFFFSRDAIFVSHYIDEGLQDTLSYNIHRLLTPSLQKRTLGEQQSVVYDRYIRRHTFILGTDQYGRDILSRMLVGMRVSLAVGLVAVILSLTIGILLGSIAGYFRGTIDNVVMYLINVLWAIPIPLLVFAITLTIGKGSFQIFVAIGLTMWVSAARFIRGQVLVLRGLEYIQAARTLGLSHLRIIFRHILPNIAGPLMVIAASNFAAAILIEAGLSFLGIGVQPPTPSLGLMTREHYNFLLTSRPFLAIIPGLAIMLLACAFNILGNALRDVPDVRDAG